MNEFQTAGAILATILVLAHLLPFVRRFFSSAIRQIKEQWRMFNHWRWWRKYRPSWEIVKIGEAKITLDNWVYHIELPIEVKYTSHDFRYDTEMDCDSALIDMLNEGSDRDKQPYRLSLKTRPGQWFLLRGESKTCQYVFTVAERGFPLLKNSTSFKVINMGDVRIDRVQGKRALKGGEFEVKVIGLTQDKSSALQAQAKQQEDTDAKENRDWQL